MKKIVARAGNNLVKFFWFTSGALQELLYFQIFIVQESSHNIGLTGLSNIG